jgi:hypothetical protein
MTALSAPEAVASAGARLFEPALAASNIEVHQLAWEPPLPGSRRALERLALRGDKISQANGEVVRRMNAAQPVISSVASAGSVIEDLDDHTFLHAGPPVTWQDMCGPLRGAVCGAAVYEGLADDPEDAARKAEAGAFRFLPCHDRSAVGPMAGVVSATMPVWVVEDAAGSGRAFATLNEGLGKVLRYGANDREVMDRLAWMKDVLGPVLRACIAQVESGVDLRSMIGQALQMGDEGHNRNRAGTSLLLRQLLPGLLESRDSPEDAASVARFIDSNDHFFLNLSMAAAKVIADAGRDVEHSSVVTAMARNGTEFGIRISGLGDRWFTGPAGIVRGLYFPGYSEADANPDIGDSTITETVGLGAFAMASAPAIVRFVGGDASQAVEVTSTMYDLCVGENGSFQLPALGFRGSPLGIDVREVARTGTLPAINTGIAHREPGVGQIGAGLVSPPEGAFVGALRALAEVP